MVADASPNAGLGHLARSNAVAAALGCDGSPVTRLCHGRESPIEFGGTRWGPLADGEGGQAELGGIVVLDTYLPPPSLVERVAVAPSQAVLFDDGEPLPALEALIVRFAGEAPADGGVLFGPRYACLGPDYWGLSVAEPSPELERVLITSGGTDPLGLIEELASEIRPRLPGVELSAALAAEPDRAIGGCDRIVVGLGSLRDELIASDLIACGGGQTMLEALAVGTPCAVLPIAANQVPQVAALERLGGVRVAGSPAALGDVIGELVADASARESLAWRGQATIDGYGALRVAYEARRRAPLDGN